MLINLHAHNVVPEMLNQHPHWGPIRELDDEGDFHLRVGDWRLSLSTIEHRAAIKEGKDGADDSLLAKIGTPEGRIAAMDAFGNDVQVLSLPAHFVMYHTDPEFAVRYAQEVNDAQAQYCAAVPDRLYFWAHAALQDPQAAAKELDRAVLDLSAKGLSMGGANFGGLEVDDEAMYPVWEKACELDVPLFVHGYNQSLSWGPAAADERYEVTSIVGMCYDETRLFWNMVCGGVLDRFPQLKIYITHGGGFVPYQLGRLEGTNEVLGDRKNKLDLEEYLPNFWFDPLIHNAAMRSGVVDVIGVDHLVYGDNFGGSDGVRIDLTDGIGLPDAEREKIRSLNAKALLKL